MKLYDTEIIINGRKLSSLEATVVMEALKDSADNGVFNDYTQYELGIILIPTVYIYKLAKKFNCSVDEIIKNH